MHHHQEEADRIVASVSARIRSGEVTMLPKWRFGLATAGRYALAIGGLVLFIALAALLLAEVTPDSVFLAAITCAKAAWLTGSLFLLAFVASAYACSFANAGVCKGKPWSSIAMALVMLFATAALVDIGIHKHTAAALSGNGQKVASLCETVAHAAER